MRVKYCKLNKSQRRSFSYLLEKYDLKSYRRKHRDRPAVFWGLYSPDLGRFNDHNSFMILVWRGTDSTHRSRIKMAKSKKNIKHISVSSFISSDLKKAGIKFKFVPLVSADMSGIATEPLGDQIYTYIPKSRYDFYGGKIVEKLKKKCKYKINISTRFNRYTHNKLMGIYKRSFCCLRLTKHDGLPNSVVEMGLMGRKAIYNGDTPNSIKWNKKYINKIIENIEIEAEKIGTVQKNVSDDMRKYINVGDKWLYKEFWDD